MAIESLEYPLPQLDVDTEHIFLDHESRFNIQNTGGSLLAGRILTSMPSLTATPSQFEDNNISVVLRYNESETDGYKPGETIETSIIITSNGGEKTIPVTIRLSQMAINTPDGWAIYNINDFYEYSQKNPIHARRVFTTSEFYMLLLTTGYKYMDIYENLHKDVHRERAMDSFFVLSGLKGKTTISLPRDKMEYSQKPFDYSMIYGSFIVQKSDWGFFEAPVSTAYGATWLKLFSERLITTDFNEANAGVVKFTIDPLSINGRYATETVIIGGKNDAGGNKTIEIIFRRPPLIKTRLNKEAFRYTDQGVIDVTNNTGEKLLVELFCKDSYVRFDNKKVYIEEHGSIPFIIKLSKFMAAQLKIKKQAVIKSSIEIKTHIGDKLHKSELAIMVGEW